MFPLALAIPRLKKFYTTKVYLQGFKQGYYFYWQLML